MRERAAALSPIAADRVAGRADEDQAGRGHGIARRRRSRRGSRSRGGSPARPFAARLRGCARRPGTTRAPARGRSRTASSAMRTCSALRSASENTATVAMPSSRHARITRTAISPRFAIRIFENTSPPTPSPACGQARGSTSPRPLSYRAIADCADRSGAGVRSHPEHSELPLFPGGVEHDRQRQAQDLPRFGGVEDAVIP